MAKRECSVDGCGKLVNRRGLCQAHAWRERKYGDPLGGKARYAECSVEDCHTKHYARAGARLITSAGTSTAIPWRVALPQ